MRICLYILLCFSLLPKTFSKTVEVTCPEHCKCDFFEKLKRATCTDRNLASVHSNLPQQTQLLDLSFNQIILLDDGVFEEEGLLSLRLLNVSHNKVSQIHMNAFRGLSHLRTLDLSYNAIQYVIRNWFFSLNSLQELYLEGNSFGKIGDEPWFASDTLKKLDLSNCRISYIGNTALSQLPNLEFLDLSRNLLIHLNVAVVQNMANLQILNAKNNTLSCDGVQRDLYSYCTRKGIRMEDPCKAKAQESEKFQRMVNLAETEDEKNSWIYDDEGEERNNETKITGRCNNSTHGDKNLLQEIVDLSPVLSLVIPFIYGVAVGVLVAYAVHTFTDGKHERSGRESRRSRLHRNRGEFGRIGRYGRAFSAEERGNLRLQEWSLSESTPVLHRKSTT